MSLKCTLETMYTFKLHEHFLSHIATTYLMLIPFSGSDENHGPPYVAALDRMVLQAVHFISLAYYPRCGTAKGISIIYISYN